MAARLFDAPPAARQPLAQSNANQTMKSRVEEWKRTKRVVTESDQDINRDLVFVIQGISGKHIQFIPGDPDRLGLSQGQFSVATGKRAPKVSDQDQDLIQDLCDLGWLFLRINEGIKIKTDPNNSAGLIEQSLCHAIQEELKDYYKLVAVLESQLARQDQASTNEDEEEPKDLRNVLDRSAITRPRLLVWTSDAAQKLRMMSTFIEACLETRGGELISRIHAFTDNGENTIKTFASKVLESISKPFFDSLYRWINYGELHDPFKEFFIELNPAVLGLRVNPDKSADEAGIENHKLWETKFFIRSEMLPTFLNEDLAKKIFATGKSLNFIKYSCQDNDWAAARAKQTKSEKNSLEYNDLAGLEQSIVNAYSFASQRLFDIFIGKFKLLNHLRALKDYLMLSRGDFVALLIEELAPAFNKPANNIYRQDLTDKLESSLVHSSAANDDPDILRRLDARMTDLSPGKIGWEVFTLEYKVDSPINTVIDPDSMDEYAKMFAQIWKMTRVGWSLKLVGEKVLAGHQDCSRVPELRPLFKRISGTLAEMTHFLRQLQYFTYSIVVECAWAGLVAYINKKQGDLDQLIRAHRDYLDRIVSKALFAGDRTGGDPDLLNKVHESFSCILLFNEAVDALCNFTLAEAARRSSPDDLASAAHTNNLPGIERSIGKYGRHFQEGANAVFSSLALHPDYDLSKLASLLNFSMYYQLKTRRSKSSLSSA